MVKGGRFNLSENFVHPVRRCCNERLLTGSSRTWFRSDGTAAGRPSLKRFPAGQARAFHIRLKPHHGIVAGVGQRKKGLPLLIGVGQARLEDSRHTHHKRDQECLLRLGFSLCRSR
jgi:hypothetical protein